MKLSRIIGGKYEILDLLGQGGTSVVYLARNIVLNNLWALKAVSKNSRWFQSEMQEITILKGLSHPMLPRVVDLIEDEDNSFIVMDYIRGSNLLEYIKTNGTIKEDKLLLWTKELLEVLRYLHGRNQPIIYRDMKPANLIVDDEGRLHMVDFGTARFHEEKSLDDTVYMGTQGYAAPEQYGTGQSDPRTDLYSLGMTLLHMATGIHPISLGNASYEKALKGSGISKTFMRYILDLLQSNPDKRPHNTAEAIKNLNSCMDGKKGKGFPRMEKRISNVAYRRVIAVTSLIPRVGLTSTCLMLANFFKGKGQRTGLAEINTSGDFLRLSHAYEQAERLSCRSDSHFEADQLIFFPEVKESSQILRKNLDILILDLGHLKNEHVVRELNRADIKLILCPGAVWKFPLIVEIREQFRLFEQEDWNYIVCSFTRKEEQELKRQIKSKGIITFPVPLNPFNVSREEEKRLDHAMEQVCDYNDLTR